MEQCLSRKSIVTKVAGGGDHYEPLTGSQSPHAEVVRVIPACISLTNAKSMVTPEFNRICLTLLSTGIRRGSKIFGRIVELQYITPKYIKIFSV